MYKKIGKQPYAVFSEHRISDAMQSLGVPILLQSVSCCHQRDFGQRCDIAGS